MGRSEKLPDVVTRRWTRSAEECYELGCICSKCKIPEIMETPCQMKASVIELVRKFGKPEHIKTKGILKDET